MKFYFAQFFGFVGLVAMIVGLFQSDKKKMLLFVVFNGLFFGVEYLLLGAFSGMYSNWFGVIRTILCEKKESDPRFNQKWILALIMFIYLVIGVVSYDSAVSLLPIIAEEIYVLSIWQSSPKVIRYGTGVMVLLWLAYDLIVAAYPSAACDLIVFVSTVTAIIMKKNEPHKQTAERN